MQTIISIIIKAQLLIFCLGSIPAAFAEETVKLPQVYVFSDEDRKGFLSGVPGAGQIVRKQDLEVIKPISTQDALKSVSGINIVETEGQGLIPRIGIRGLDPSGSRKLLVLEDGIPIQLAPYADPSMYWSPPIERFEKIEVIKGSGSLRYGPQTIGGVVNYHSILQSPRARISLNGGNQKARSLLASTHQGSVIAQYLYKTGDGNRDFNAFKVHDALLKTVLDLSDNQSLMFKFSLNTVTAEATYMGQTQKMFDRNVRENAAQNDELTTQRYALDLTHSLSLGADANLLTTFYGISTERDWWRQAYGYTADRSEIVLNSGNAGRLRKYTVGGVESRFAYKNLLTGLRLHTENMENRRVNGAGALDRSGALIDDDERTTLAYSGFIENTFQVAGPLKLVPGIRFERYHQGRRLNRWGSIDLNQTVKTRDLEMMAGLGGVYSLNSTAEFYAGAHQGFAPPRVEDAINNSGQVINLNAERSINSELGFRFSGEQIQFDLTYFRLDFSNQLIQSAASGGAAGTQLTNAGKTVSEGLEFSGHSDLYSGDHSVLFANHNLSWIPVARLNSKRIINGIDRNQNRLPYAPKWMGSMSIGVRSKKPHRNWSVQSTFQGNSYQFADFENTVTATADGLRGKIQSVGLIHLSASYDLNEYLQLNFTVKNVFDRKYIASRAPEGIFPGQTRLWMIGVEGRF